MNSYESPERAEAAFYLFPDDAEYVGIIENARRIGIPADETLQRSLMQLVIRGEAFVKEGALHRINHERFTGTTTWESEQEALLIHILMKMREIIESTYKINSEAITSNISAVVRAEVEAIVCEAMASTGGRGGFNRTPTEIDIALALLKTEEEIDFADDDTGIKDGAKGIRSLLQMKRSFIEPEKPLTSAERKQPNKVSLHTEWEEQPDPISTLDVPLTIKEKVLIPLQEWDLLKARILAAAGLHEFPEHVIFVVKRDGPDFCLLIEDQYDVINNFGKSCGAIVERDLVDIANDPSNAKRDVKHWEKCYNEAVENQFDIEWNKKLYENAVRVNASIGAPDTLFIFLTDAQTTATFPSHIRNLGTLPETQKMVCVVSDPRRLWPEGLNKNNAARCIEWEPTPKNSNAHDMNAERLASLAMPLVRVEPSLLRAFRRTIMPGADVGTEKDTLPYFPTQNSEAFGNTTDPDAVNEAAERWKEESLVVKKEIVAMTRAWRNADDRISPIIFMIELLNFYSLDPECVDPEEVDNAMKLIEEKLESCLDTTADPMTLTKKWAFLRYALSKLIPAARNIFPAIEEKIRKLKEEEE